MFVSLAMCVLSIIGTCISDVPLGSAWVRLVRFGPSAVCMPFKARVNNACRYYIWYYIWWWHLRRIYVVITSNNVTSYRRNVVHCDVVTSCHSYQDSWTASVLAHWNWVSLFSFKSIILFEFIWFSYNTGLHTTRVMCTSGKWQLKIWPLYFYMKHKNSHKQNLQRLPE